MEYSPVTVVESKSFCRKAGRLLSENGKDELIAYLSLHPSAGILIKGTGGIRKLNEQSI